MRVRSRLTFKSSRPPTAAIATKKAGSMIEKAPHKAGLSVLLDSARAPYIMPSIPPMPPGGIAGPSSFFGFSATVASVVISSPAIDAAF